jgi:hypothetical protein
MITTSHSMLSINDNKEMHDYEQWKMSLDWG